MLCFLSLLLITKIILFKFNPSYFFSVNLEISDFNQKNKKKIRERNPFLTLGEKKEQKKNCEVCGVTRHNFKVKIPFETEHS